jgi:hypothetical protein
MAYMYNLQFMSEQEKAKGRKMDKITFISTLAGNIGLLITLVTDHL